MNVEEARPGNGTTGSARATSTSERLLHEAAALFGERGYDATTTRELAARLGITKATLYHHIATKEDLLYAMCLESLRHSTEAVTRVAETAPDEDRLRQMIVTHMTTTMANRDIHRVGLAEMRRLSPERLADIRRRRHDYSALLQGAIERDQAAGRIRADTDAHLLALALLSLVNWPLFWFSPGRPVGIDELAELFVSIFLDGVRERPTP